MDTYAECINSLGPADSPSVLLGNGFSRAWNNDIFNYASLLAAADFAGREAELRDLFDRFETYDFEKVMQGLNAAQHVLEAYGGVDHLVATIQADRQLLKNALITAISDTHPTLPRDVTDDQFVAVRTFLSRFEQVFTLNYDLLFYWARNKDRLAPAGYRTDDGFRYPLKWKQYGTEQNVFFLHGGLHIYDNGASVEKHACTDNGISIVEQVRENLEHGRFPLFVSEPTAEAKLNRIERHPYLNYCFGALRGLRGSLFIHGHSMDENDRHIFDQIKESRAPRVFVSIFGDEDSPANIRAMVNARAYLGGGGRAVEFYAADTAPVWA